MHNVETMKMPIAVRADEIFMNAAITIIPAINGGPL